MYTRKAYRGTQRKLIIAMDVGTTFSAVSYCLLDPGVIPEIKPVTRFPAQEHVGGDAKIPSVIYYGENGSVKAVGAEATCEGIFDKAEEEGWVLAKWFKLHLRPSRLSNTNSSDPDITAQFLHPLPSNKSAIDVFSDYLRYLFTCTKSFIIESMPNGSSFWSSVESANSIHFVLSHPNGWEGPQQSAMRRAAIRAGLIKDKKEEYARVQFVTEGEASLHYCLNNGCKSLPGGIIIVDAGGGTIDLSAYKMEGTSSNPNANQDHDDKFSFEEIARPQCHFTGSIFVTAQARTALQVKLANSPYLDDLDLISECFDKTTKLRFKDSNETTTIRFGGRKDTDLDVGIKWGQMKLAGAEVAKFFEPSIQSVMQAIVMQQEDCDKRVDMVFLVGGFAASDFLFKKLEEFLEPTGVGICRPQNYLNKAVADGAVSYYIDHFVISRVARWHYGVELHRYFLENNDEHKRRKHTAYVNPGGHKVIPGGFDSILSKGTAVAETKEFRKAYVIFCKPENKRSIETTRSDILYYRGQNPSPTWVDEDADNYVTLCAVEANTSALIPNATRVGPNGLYYLVRYSIILSFGLTELKAEMAWEENGVEKRGPAEIIYGDTIILKDE